MLQRRIEPAEFGFVPKHFVSGDANDLPYRRAANDFMRQAGGVFPSTDNACALSGAIDFSSRRAARKSSR